MGNTEIDSDTFFLKTNSRVIIYGVGGNGLKLQKVLIEDGIVIEAFVDKRSDELKYVRGTRVIGINEIPLIINHEELIAIISIKNVFEHAAIANTLLEQGVNRIIYVPKEYLLGKNSIESQTMAKVHDDLIENKIIPYDIGLKLFDGSICILDDNKWLIGEEDEQVRTWMPYDLICNYDEQEAYGRIPMFCFFPLVDLFEDFLGKNKGSLEHEKAVEVFFQYCMEYVYKQDITITEGLKDSLLASRSKVFGRMIRSYDIDNDFFIRNCPRMAWREGLFYIDSSGRNRVSLQIANGRYYIPVCISRNDFEKWENEDIKCKVTEYIQEHRMQKIPVPIPHPVFSGMEIEEPEYFKLFVKPIMNEIYKQIYSEAMMKTEKEYSVIDSIQVSSIVNNKKIVFCMNDVGQFARVMKLNGFKVMSLFSNNQDLEMLLDELFYVTPRGEEHEYVGSILIMDSSKGYLIEKNRLKLFNAIYVLDRVDEKNFDISLEDYGFIFQDVLFDSIWNSKHVRGLYYIRED